MADRFGRSMSRRRQWPIECNLCGGRATHFDPLDHVEPLLARDFAEAGLPWPNTADYETLNVEGYGCPWCHSSDRDRLIALYLQHNRIAGAESPRLRLLDIAPSPPLRAWLKSLRQLDYRSADLYRPDVDDRVDIQSMPQYEVGRFDLLICSHVLEHVRDDRLAIAEILRVLSPRGRALLLVPVPLRTVGIDEDPTITDPMARLLRFGQRDHVRVYSRQGFLERLRASGGRVETFGVQQVGAAVFQACSLAHTSQLYVLSRN